MAGLKLRSRFVVLSAALAWAFLTAPAASSCPFCQEERGPTLLAAVTLVLRDGTTVYGSTRPRACP